MKVFKTNIGDSASALRQNLDQNEKDEGEEHFNKGDPKKRGRSESIDSQKSTSKKLRLENSNPDGQD